MKKIIFGGAAAILAVIGFSAFKSAKTTTGTYYWFEINSGESFAIGSPVALSNADVAFIDVVGSTVASSSCDKTQTFQCLVGYTASKVTGTPGSYTLKTVNGNLLPTTAPHGTGKSIYVRSTK